MVGFFAEIFSVLFDVFNPKHLFPTEIHTKDVMFMMYFSGCE